MGVARAHVEVINFLEREEFRQVRSVMHTYTPLKEELNTRIQHLGNTPTILLLLDHDLT